MHRLASTALICCCAALSMLVALEWHAAPGFSQKASAAPINLPASVMLPHPASAPPYAAQVLQRPLFNWDRRPALPQASAARSPVPRLSAILIGPAGKWAIFVSLAGGKPLTLQEGGSVDGFVVRSIKPDHVDIARGDGAQVLHTTYAPFVPDPS